MAHSESYTKVQTRSVIKEILREFDDYKNNVDLNKSNENYFYQNISGSKGVWDTIEKRITEVMQGRRWQKQQKLCFSWVVSCPEELKDNRAMQDKFFDAINRFNEERFGKENVILSGVHRDETNPHYHSLIMPVCKSRKNGKDTISYASHSMGKNNSYRVYQVDLEKFITQELGIENLILNGKTEFQNVSMDNYKKLKDQEKEFENARENNKKVIEKQKNAFNRRQNDYKALDVEFKSLERKVSKLKNSISEAQGDLDSINAEIKNKRALFDKLRHSYDELVEFNRTHANSKYKRVQEHIERDTGWKPEPIANVPDFGKEVNEKDNFLQL